MSENSKPKNSTSKTSTSKTDEKKKKNSSKTRVTDGESKASSKQNVASEVKPETSTKAETAPIFAPSYVTPIQMQNQNQNPNGNPNLNLGAARPRVDLFGRPIPFTLRQLAFILFKNSVIVTGMVSPLVIALEVTVSLSRFSKASYGEEGNGVEEDTGKLTYLDICQIVFYFYCAIFLLTVIVPIILSHMFWRTGNKAIRLVRLFIVFRVLVMIMILPVAILALFIIYSRSSSNFVYVVPAFCLFTNLGLSYTLVLTGRMIQKFVKRGYSFDQPIPELMEVLAASPMQMQMQMQKSAQQQQPEKPKQAETQ